MLHLIRGVKRFSLWAQETALTVQALDAHALEAFGQHLHSLQRLHYPSGRLSHLFVGARHFVRFLERSGLVAPVAPATAQRPPPALLTAFRHWMRTHRGTTEATLKNYRLTIIDLLHTLGEHPEHFEAKALRHFVLARAEQQGIGQAKTVVTAVRMFLRFLIAVGRCHPGLAHALPTIAHWRLSSLPRYLPAESVERVLMSCDRDHPHWAPRSSGAPVTGTLRAPCRGCRCLTMGRYRLARRHAVRRRQESTPHAPPAPARGGRRPAGLCRRTNGRRIPSAYVFLTVTAPLKPASPQTISQIAARALRRAKVESPIYGAHVLRHSAATQMLRQGASLSSIGAVLRHASVETTAPYAKVDTALLQEVARAWPEVQPCS